MAMDKLGLKNMNDVMGDLFESKDGVDVTFIVHEKELQAHKWILTSRSAVFKAMLEGPMAPEDQRHKISDPKITFEDFQRFLKFLYIDKCEQNLDKSQIKALIHLGCLYDVLILVEKYTDQIKFCFLSCNDTYEYAKMSQEYLPATSKLLQKCVETLVIHHFDAPLAFQKDDGTLEWISSELVMEIIKRRSQDGMISEDAVFKKVFEWAKNECHRKNERFPTPEDIQEIMLPLMPYFYLSKLHPLTMATIIKTNKLIPDEQLINYLAQHLVETFERPCCGRPFCHRGGRGGGGGGEHADLRSLPPRGGRGRGGYI